MLVIIDYGMGNLTSILNLCERIGADAIISSKLSDIHAADRLILPGVGNFAHAMKNLRQLDIPPLLTRKVREQKTPLLGICLGMQLLARCSEEGGCEGLGWLDAEVVKFRFGEQNARLRIPHVGFNSVEMKQSPLFKYLAPNPHFYFTHSYYMKCNDPDKVIGTSHYGYPFTSIVQDGNIYGTQFHPEKSHTFGINLIKGFVEAV